MGSFENARMTFLAPDGSKTHGQLWEGKHGEHSDNPKVTGTIKKVSWWHKSIVDWMYSNPHRTKADCAEFFSVQPAWISTITNSDAFRAYENSRRIEHNGNVSKSVIEQVEGLAALSMEVLHERIKAERKTINLSGVMETADMALKALGFGAKANGNGGGNAGNVVQINIVDPATLARSRERMRLMNGEGEGESVGGIQIENSSA